MVDMGAAAIAANRFGFGAKPGELRVIAGDPRGWVKAQITPETALPPSLAALPPAEDDLLAFGRWLVARRLKGANADKALARAANMGYSEDELKTLSIEQSFVLNFKQRYTTAVKARIDAAATTDRPVFERLAHFWANHFMVSGVKPQVVALPPSFEREAIRPNICGSFEKLLVSSTRHPGMLIYLDNWLSIGPHSPAATAPRVFANPNANRPTGLNENLAREIMELHTMGVRSGYTQADVTAFAAVLTGWTYDRGNPLAYLTLGQGTRTGEQMFRFQPGAHEPGPQTIMGKIYPQKDDLQGLAVLHDFAHHPATAHFIATKLARHYIADDPPPAAVNRIAAAFSKSGGDLQTTMNAVVDCPEAWAAPFAKFKPPEEFMISFLRLLSIPSLPADAITNSLAVMGQPTYRAAGPDGWSDVAASWLSADLVWKRLEWAQAACARIARADIDPSRIADLAFGDVLSDDTRLAIARAESPAQGLTLLAGSPEFQRR